MNDRNFNKWIADLLTTEAPQVTGQLSNEVVSDDGEETVVGYCCLGRGEVVRGAAPEGCFVSGSAATSGFVQWLGFDVPEADGDEYDDDDRTFEFDIVIMDDPGHPSAAGMNDNGFPFPKIAQVLLEHRDHLALHQV